MYEWRQAVRRSIRINDTRHTADNIYYLGRGGYVFVRVSLCVCLSAGSRNKSLNRFSQNSGEKVAHGPRNKPLDFGGNPGHVTLGLWVRVGLRLRLAESETYTAVRLLRIRVDEG